MLSLLFLILGFIPLIYGAELLVDASSSLAKRMDIPNIVIGLTIVAFGTSAPELIVNIFSSIDHNSDIALGNVLGSNIFNLLGILGVAAIIYPLTVKTNTTWIEIPLCLLSSVVILVVANDMFFESASESVINRVDGIILLLFFIIFIGYNIQMMKTGTFTETVPVKSFSVKKAVLLVIAGLALLVIGGRIIVMYAVEFATDLGISQRIIALTIVSIGTSLPELATSAVAAKKKNVDIAIGNIVGSNIFNVFYVLGASAVIYPVGKQPLSNIDMFVNVFASLLVFTFIFTGKQRKIDRLEGSILIFFYAAYIAALILM